MAWRAWSRSSPPRRSPRRRVPAAARHALSTLRPRSHTARRATVSTHGAWCHSRCFAQNRSEFEYACVAASSGACACRAGEFHVLGANRCAHTRCPPHLRSWRQWSAETPPSSVSLRVYILNRFLLIALFLPTTLKNSSCSSSSSVPAPRPPATGKGAINCAMLVCVHTQTSAHTYTKDTNTHTHLNSMHSRCVANPAPPQSQRKVPSDTLAKVILQILPSDKGSF